MPKPGVIYQYAGHSAPDGFLMCDGSAVSRTVYAELFAVIGTTYGTGDGSTTFNVPDLRGRVGIGVGDTYDLGNVGGEEKHKLTKNELPSKVDAIYSSAYGSWNGTLTSGAIYSNGDSNNWSTVQDALLFNNADQPHNNMQPYTVINYIISTGQGGVDTAEILGGMSQLPLSIANGGTGAVSKEAALQGFGVEDYVVAQGGSGIWEWRKWNSGVAECWCTDECYGDASGQTETIRELPFVFITQPQVICTYDGGDSWRQRLAPFAYATKTQVIWYAYSNYSGNYTYRVSIRIKGGWK